MKNFEKLTISAIALCLVLALGACREKTTGEKLEDAVEDAGDAIEDGAEDLGDSIEDGIENTKEAIEEAGEN